jgi:hypothetical protein
MARVELRDIVTEEERAAAIALRVAPGQDQFVAGVADSLPIRVARFLLSHHNDGENTPQRSNASGCVQQP